MGFKDMESCYDTCMTADAEYFQVALQVRLKAKLFTLLNYMYDKEHRLITTSFNLFCSISTCFYFAALPCCMQDPHTFTPVICVEVSDGRNILCLDEVKITTMLDKLEFTKPTDYLTAATTVVSLFWTFDIS